MRLQQRSAKKRSRLCSALTTSGSLHPPLPGGINHMQYLRGIRQRIIRSICMAYNDASYEVSVWHTTTDHTQKLCGMLYLQHETHTHAVTDCIADSVANTVADSVAHFGAKSAADCTAHFGDDSVFNSVDRLVAKSVANYVDHCGADSVADSVDHFGGNCVVECTDLFGANSVADSADHFGGNFAFIS